MGATSEHFTHAELACKHCNLNNCQPTFVSVLEIFRGKTGPLVVNDAYRCPTHNREVGGAPRSQHMLGIAADVHSETLTPAELETIARTIPHIKGIGRADYQNYLHIDIRPIPAQWCYDESGKECPYYAERSSESKTPIT